MSPVRASGDDGGQAAADGAPISGAAAGAEAAAGDKSQGSAVVVAANARAASGPPVLAISDLIRSAAEQASATWKTAAVPTQRRESPGTTPGTTPFRAIAPAAPAAPSETSAIAAPISPSPAPESTAYLAEDTLTVELPAAAPARPAEPAEPTEPPAPVDTEAEAAEAAEAADAHWPGARRQIAILTSIVCLLILAVLLGHRYLPDVLGFGSLIDTFLPWTAAPLLLALPASLLTLKKWAIGVCLLSCAVWAGDFGPTLLRTGGSGPADLRILSQNVSADDTGVPDLSGVARLAEQRGADIVVLQGLSKDVQLADQAAPAGYTYHMAMYEFVVWSRFPLGAGQPVDLAGGRLAQSGAAAGNSTSGEFGGLLRFTVNVGAGRQVTVYAVHLPQPSLSHDGFGVARGEALEQLVDDVEAEQAPNLVVVGDLDVAQTDRAIGPLLGSSTGLVSAQTKAGGGFGFTWPAKFPVVRLDDVLTRGLKPVASVVLPAVGPKQAHRPIEADLRF